MLRFVLFRLLHAIPLLIAVIFVILLMLQLYGLPLAQTLTGGAFAQEIVRTLSGSIGLVLAIPLTTAVAAVVAVRSDPAVLGAAAGAGHSHGHAHAVTD